MYLLRFGCLESLRSSVTYWHRDRYREHVCGQEHPQHPHIPMVLLSVAVLMEQMPMFLYCTVQLM